MKFRVKFVVSKSDNRHISLVCTYVPPDPMPAIAEMMGRCTECIRRELEKRDPSFRDCIVVISLFRQIQGDEE